MEINLNDVINRQVNVKTLYNEKDKETIITKPYFVLQEENRRQNYDETDKSKLYEELSKKQDSAEYKNRFYTLTEGGHLDCILNAGDDLEKREKLFDAIIEREDQKERAIEEDEEIKAKFSCIKDENLKEALRLMADAGDKSFRILLDAFATRNALNTKETLDKLFNDISALTTHPQSYIEFKNASDFVKISEYSKAALLLLDSPLVKQWKDITGSARLRNKVILVSSLCNIVYAVFQKSAAKDLGNKMGELKANDNIFNSIESYVKVKFNFSDDIDKPLEPIKLETKEKKFEDYNLKAEELGLEDTQLAARLADYYNDEHIFESTSAQMQRINDTFESFRRDKCLMNGKFPLPSIARCNKIKEEGSLTEKFVLMISIQSVIKQGFNVMNMGQSKDMLNRRGLKTADVIFNELAAIQNDLKKAIYSKSGDAAETADRFFEVHKLSAAFSYFARAELNDAITNCLNDIGVRVDEGDILENASERERSIAYCMAASSGHDLAYEIIKSDTFNDANSDYYKTLNLSANQDRFEYTSLNRANSNFAEELEFYSTTEATKYLIGYEKDGYTKKDSENTYYEIFENYIEDTIQSYADAGLFTDEYGLELRKMLLEANKLTDKNKKDKKNNFKRLITDPLIELIKSSNLDKDNKRSKAYENSFLKLLKNLDEYIGSHNPYTQIGKDRLALAKNLQRLLRDNDWEKNEEYFGFTLIDIETASKASEENAIESGDALRGKLDKIFNKAFHVIHGGDDYMKLIHMSNIEANAEADEKKKYKSRKGLYDDSAEGIFDNISDRDQAEFFTELVQECKALYDIPYATRDFLETINSVGYYICADNYETQQMSLKKSIDLIDAYILKHENDQLTNHKELLEHMETLKVRLLGRVNGTLLIPEDTPAENIIVAANPSVGFGGKYKSVRDYMLFPHEPSPNDVKQRTTDDCYMLSALSAIAYSNPEYIKESMRDNGDTVTVRFFDPDKDYAPVYITVSKEIPVYKGVGLQKNAVDCLWVQMIEKAFVALYGNEAKQEGADSNAVDNMKRSYGAIDYKNSFVFMKRYAGRDYDATPFSILPMDDNFQDYEDGDFENVAMKQPAMSYIYSGVASRLYDDFEHRLNEGEIITVGITKESANVKLSKDRGFRIKHAYAVLKVFSAGRNKYVRLRDPYGAFSVGYDGKNRSVNTGNSTLLYSTSTMGTFDLEWNDFINTFNMYSGCKSNHASDVRPPRYITMEAENKEKAKKTEEDRLEARRNELREEGLSEKEIVATMAIEDMEILDL